MYLKKISISFLTYHNIGHFIFLVVIILVQVYDKPFLNWSKQILPTSKFEPIICWWQHDERRGPKNFRYKAALLSLTKIDCNHRLSSLLSGQQPPKFFQVELNICWYMPNLSLSFIWHLGDTHTQLTNYSSKENPKSQQTTKQTSILFHVKVAPKNIIYTNSKRWRCLIWIWDYFSLPTSALSRISLANMVLLAALSKAKDFVVWSWTYLWALWFLLVSYLLRK